MRRLVPTSLIAAAATAAIIAAIPGTAHAAAPTGR